MSETSRSGRSVVPRRRLPGGSRHSQWLALEPRMLFDGAAVDTAVHVTSADHAPDAPPAATANPRELLVVDTAVRNWQAIAALAKPATDVLVLDPSTDALAQIAARVEGGEPYAAVHVLSHGVAGGIILNGRTLDASTLADYRGDLTRIGAGLTADGDLLLYGCDVASGQSGAGFLSALAAATGADVAASTDATGNAGDWVLESATGPVASGFTDQADRLAAVDTVLAAQPTVSLSVARQQVLIGEDFSFQVSFANGGGPESGFGPYIAIFVPAAGRDPDNASVLANPLSSQEGITLSSATYLGLPLTMRQGVLTSAAGSVRVSFADGGTAPLHAIPAGYRVGDIVYTIQLPFGSYTSGQPAIAIDVRGSLGGFADVDQDLRLTVQGGFRFGQDALDNPGTDAPILGATTSLTIDPSLYRVTTTYLGPENETATGPSQLRGYRIDVDVAAGQTLTDLALSQVLQDESLARQGLRFVRIDNTSGVIGGTNAGPPPGGAWTNVNGVLVSSPASSTATPTLGGTAAGLAPADVALANGGTITRTIASVTGTTATRDASMVVQFFVPETDNAGVPVIDPASGDSTFWAVDTEVVGNWVPTDTDDTAQPVTYNTDVDAPSGNAHVLEVEALAIQKSGAVAVQIPGGGNGVTPGDIVEYALAFQLSDFFAFDQLTVRDMVSDGQTVLPLGAGAGQFTPTLTVTYDDASGARVTRTLDFSATRFTTVTAAAGAAGFGTPDRPGFFDALGGFQNVRPDETRTFVTFDVAGLLQDNGLDPRMAGDLFAGDGVDDTSTGVIRFRTAVNEAYVDRVQGAGANLDLNEGDTLEDAVTADGRVLNGAFAPTGAREFDDSSASLSLGQDAVDLTIYARDGSTDNTDNRLTRIVPGDTVTYRLRYTVPTGDYDNFTLSAFLPLPTLSTTDFDADGVTDADLSAGGALNNFTLAATGSTPNGTAPLAGQFSFGPTHFDGIELGNDGIPANAFTHVSTDAVTNGITFDLGTRNDASPAPRQIDILFTVRASDRPFADEGFFLTALTQQSDQNTPGAPSATQDIDQITLTQPVLAIHKGVVRDAEAGTHTFTPLFRQDDTTTNVTETGLVAPAGTGGNGVLASITGDNSAQLDTDVLRVDGGDTVRYAVVIDNSGSAASGAFDIRVRDELPFGLTAADVANLRITRGNTTTPLDISGGGVVINANTGAAITTQAALAAALFGSDGIEFIDGTTGFLGRGVQSDGSAVTDGSNLVTITYDVTVPTGLEAGSRVETSARLLSYSGRDGAAGTLAAPGAGDYTQLAALDTDGTVDGILSEEAAITIAGALMDKTLLGTSDTSNPAAPVFTANGIAVIGEQVRYRVQVTLPEGRSSGAVITDTLNAGLAFVGIDSIAFGAGITATGGTDAALLAGITAANFSADGRTFTLTLGDVVNSDSDNTTAQTITVEYRAVVLDTAANQANAQRSNLANFSSGGGLVSVNDFAVAVILREPVVTIDVTPDGGSVDAGDVVTFTVTVRNTGAAGTPTAFDVALDRPVLPPGLVYVPGSWTQTTGPAFSLDPAFDADVAAGTSPGIAALAPGESATFTFQAAVPLGVTLGDTLTATETVRYSSLPGTTNVDLSPFTTADDTERDGSGGVNDYAATDSGSVSVPAAAPLLRIVGSSEAGTAPAAGAVEASANPRTDTRVTVGEIVRYRMVVQLPESTTTDARITPHLPPGLQYLNDGTTTIGFVSDGGMSSGGASAVTGAGLALGDAAFAGGAPGSPADVATAAPVVVLNAANIDFGGGSGTDPVFRIGDIVNADSDADAEFVVIEFNALVTNEAFNQSGRVIGDGVADPGTPDPAFDFAVSRDVGGVQTTVLTSNPVTQTLLEPAIIDVDKHVVATDGTTITYEVTFRNSGSATAHGIVLTDEFAGLPGLAFGGPASVIATGSPGVSGIADASDADTATVTIDEIPVNGSVTVRYTATVAPGAAVAGNPAVVRYSSLDLTPAEQLAGGEQLTAAGVTSTGGAAGSATGARTGADGLPVNEANLADTTAPLNNFRDQDSAALGVVRGTLWDDTGNRDGVIDPGEARLGGLPVTLTWAGVDGILGNGDDSVITTSTRPDGSFEFSALPAGSYRISATPSATVVIAGDTDIVTPRFDVGAGNQTDGLIDLTVAEGAVITGQNVGYQRANDPPVIAALDPTSASTYTEGGAPVVIDPDVTFADPEIDGGMDDWNGASLTVQRQGGANGDDTLGSPLIAANGDVIVGGLVIGTADTTVPGRLVVSFNGNATSANVTDFARSLTYANGSDVPPAGVTLDYTLTDGNAGPQGSGGVLSTTQSVTVPIAAVNDNPVIQALDHAGGPAFTQGGPAVAIDGDVTLRDPEIDAGLDDWNSGRLIVARDGGAQAQDVIASPLIAGNGDVVVGGVVIGTADTATPGRVAVTFNGNATSANITEFARSLTYANNAVAAPSGVTLRYDLFDGNAGALPQGANPDLATSALVLVPIGGVNDPPVIASLDPVAATPYTEDGTPVSIDTDVSVADPEIDGGLDDWNGASFTVQRQGGANGDDVIGSPLIAGGNVVVGGVVIGTVDTSVPGRLLVNFNAAATSATIDQFARSLTYASNSDVPPTGVTLDYTLTDGNAGPQGSGGVLSTTRSVTIPIAPVNDNPTIAALDHAGGPAFAEGGTAVVIDGDVVLGDPEIDAALDNWDSGRLIVARDGGAQAQDVIASPLIAGNGDVVVGGVVIGTADTATPGRVAVTFNGNATSANITEFARSLTYANTSVAPPADVTLRYDLFDGNAGALPQGANPDLATSRTVAIPIAARDDPPLAGNNALQVAGGSSRNPIPLAGLVSDPDTPLPQLSIRIDRVPDPAARGVLTLADGTVVTPGMTLTVAQFQGMTFTPSAALQAAPGTTALLSGGSMGYTVSDPGGGAASGNVDFTVAVAGPVIPVVPLPAPPADAGPAAQQAPLANGGNPANPPAVVLPPVIVPPTSREALVAPNVVPGGGPGSNAIAAADVRAANLVQPSGLDNSVFVPVVPAVPVAAAPPADAPAALAAGPVPDADTPVDAVVAGDPEPAPAVEPPAALADETPAEAAAAPAEAVEEVVAAAPPPAPPVAVALAPIVEEIVDDGGAGGGRSTGPGDPAGKVTTDCTPTIRKPVKVRARHARPKAVPTAELASGPAKAPAARAFSELLSEARDKAKPKIRLKPKVRHKPAAPPALPKC